MYQTVINVLGVDVDIRPAETLEIRGETGLFFPVKNTIVYALGQEADELRETLLHEVLHAVDMKTAGADSLEERDIHRISACLFAVIQANPDFAMYLMSGVDPSDPDTCWDEIETEEEPEGDLYADYEL